MLQIASASLWKLSVFDRREQNNTNSPERQKNEGSILNFLLKCSGYEAAFVQNKNINAILGAQSRKYPKRERFTLRLITIK